MSDQEFMHTPDWVGDAESLLGFLIDEMWDRDILTEYESTSSIRFSGDQSAVFVTYGNVKFTVDYEPEDDINWEVTCTFEDGSAPFIFDNLDDWDDIAAGLKGRA